MTFVRITPEKVILNNQITMPAPTPFGEMLNKVLDRAEALMFVLVIAGVACHFLGMSSANQVMVIAFSGLAIVFFLNAYRPPAAPTAEQADRKDFFALLTQTILPKLLWISCAVGAAALAMVHMQAAAAAYQQMFMIQGVAVVGCLIVVGLASAQGKNVQHLVPIIYRAIPLALAGGHFLGYY